MSKQIRRDFILPDAIDGTRLRLDSNQAVRVNVDGNDVELIKLIDGSAVGPQGVLAAKSAVDGLVEKLTLSFKKKIVVTSNDLTHVDLDHKIVPSSLRVTVGRLIAHEGEDYTLSQVANITRIVWAGSLVSGPETLEVGDKVHLHYEYFDASGASGNNASLASLQEQLNSQSSLSQENQIKADGLIELRQTDIAEIAQNKSDISSAQNAIGTLQSDLQSAQDDISSLAELVDRQDDSTIDNNQTEPAEAMSYLFDPAKLAYVCDFYLRRETDTQARFEMGQIFLRFHNGQWVVSVQSNFDNAGVSWSVSGDKLHYISDDLSGSNYSSSLMMIIRPLS